MGLIGMLIAVVVMILGIGYFFFFPPTSRITAENQNSFPNMAEGISEYKDMKEAVVEVKDLVEEKVIESMKEPKEEKSTPVVEETNTLSITDRLMTSGYSTPSKSRSIDTIVLHSSYNPNGGDAYSVSALVKIYESYGVSAHYLIDREGKIYRLVADNNIAYHAGVSKMPDGRKDVNYFSIGIEIMNKEDTQFTKAQYEAVNNLVASLKKKYTIKSVVGHGDIAPDRKTDPWNFDWKKLK